MIAFVLTHATEIIAFFAALFAGGWFWAKNREAKKVSAELREIKRQATERELEVYQRIHEHRSELVKEHEQRDKQAAAEARRGKRDHLEEKW